MRNLFMLLKKKNQYQFKQMIDNNKILISLIKKDTHRHETSLRKEEKQ